MYNLWQIDSTGDRMSHTRSNTDGKQILRKYYENKTTQNQGHSFNIHLIEKVHSGFIYNYLNLLVIFMSTYKFINIASKFKTYPP